jgi:hypothetical protein
MIKKYINSALSQVAIKQREDKETALYKAFLKSKAKMGGKLFGDVPAGHRRDFFCLDENTWVWHEEWTDATGQHHVVSTRYEVRPNEILKSQNGSQYQKVSETEVRRLAQAAQLYLQQIKKDLARPVQ